MTVGEALLATLILPLIAIFVLRVVPVLRHGRMVVLDHPKPCSMHEAQHALDRLVRAGFDAEIVGDADTGLNTLGKARRANGLYVIQVPRKQEKAANNI